MSEPIRFLDRLDRCFLKGEKKIDAGSNFLIKISGLFLVLLMIHTVLDVFVRFFLPFVLPATIEIIGYYYMIGAVFLALAAVEKDGGHIRVEAFDNHVSQGVLWSSRLLGKIVTILFVSVLLYGGAHRLQDAWQSNEVTFGHYSIHLWPGRLLFVVGVFAFCVVSVIGLLRLLRPFGTVTPYNSNSGKER
ncbi:MAG: TRAP transporter small permease [Hyphomicrobiaceae bacterium]|nr:TRAP transporter small permease [Hyphomicrobiaceae bacterium]